MAAGLIVLVLEGRADGNVGCGRFFEGTAEQMHQALNVILAKLPDDTLVYVSALSSNASTLDLQAGGD